MRSGLPFSHTVELTGPVVGDLTWSLSDPEDAVVATGTVPIAAGAVSATIDIAAIDNTLAGAQMWGARDLSWSYTTGTTLVSGELRYLLELAIPFPVTPTGVRTKLGLSDASELTDVEIPLLRAYLEFRTTVGSATLAAVTDDLERLAAASAIEALAGLELLPTLQVRVAQREASGTNQFNRGTVDWEKLEAHLRAIVDAGVAAVDPALALTNNGVSLLQLVTPSVDLFPGA